MEFFPHKSIIEAIIFSSSGPIAVKDLQKVININEQEIMNAINQLIEEYSKRDSGIKIIEIAGGYQMATRPEYGTWIRKFKKNTHSSKLSQASLETLAIIAYKQPMTKLEIDHIRGVNSDGAVKSLIDRRLIKIVGKKEAPGRPFLYGTTNDFLQYFGLKNLTELPPINDFIKEEAA
ncbi:MAG: SMC-Scp complex subunit ScpB [Thermodesulfovibrionales bacterium]|nr:SMC-Scp complex subunit ScpB [Thermodesulfovibrionales bacterium]